MSSGPPPIDKLGYVQQKLVRRIGRLVALRQGLEFCLGLLVHL